MANEFSPLSGSIPSYRFEQLSEIANSARYHLKRKSRTDTQIITVQKLIFELIDVYFEDKKNEAITELEIEKTQEMRYEHEYVDLYPFAAESSRYGEHWVFIGDESDLGDIPTYENTDEIDALYDILEWLPDNESNEGFTDANPSEYFAALTLSLIADVISMTEEYYKDSVGNLYYFSHICDIFLKIGKSSNFMNEAYLEQKYEDKISEILVENEKLKNELDELMGKQKKAEIKKRKNIDKAVNSRHKKNREAKSIVCSDWEINKNNFKSTMKAAEHYASWLENKNYFYSSITIRNWIFLYAKENNIKL
ncbi:hypothetical protein [Xenorhabdus taiwanensis]|uniref:Uncharacterized protein n=1 Tax=Xenorhabdus taiwanensis TaxID=3085177 RepID=A0ABN7C648_9GAMM|nr:hypothetical protein TCT1_27920 [Xenorhabdus sp. TCT-1]